MVRVTVAHATLPSLKDRIRNDVGTSRRHSDRPSLKDRIRLDVRYTQYHAGTWGAKERSRLAKAANDQATLKARIELVRG